MRFEVLPEPFSACVCASLSCVKAHIVLHDDLCLLASAKNNIPKNDIMKLAVSFYDDNAIIRTKDEFSKLRIEKK